LVSCNKGCLTSRVVQKKGWRTGNMGMYAFLDIQIQVMLVTEEIGNLLLSIALLLEEIGDLEKQNERCVSLEYRT